MILYEVFPNKTLKIRENENTYITENLISSVHIKLPSTFGDYPVKELTAELRFYFPEGNYMAYAVDTQQARPEVPITNDITEKPQTLSVMLFFYKGGNVIGKTNSVDKVILDAPLKGEPLTPRAEADEKIREQRETIAEQAETITAQTETISSQGEQITELSGEVTELTTENMRLETLTETQNDTIQYMIDNPPSLEYPENPVVPTRQAQTVHPSENYYGIGRLEVAGYVPNNENKTATPSTVQQTIMPEDRYDGLGKVIINPTPLEEKTVSPSTTDITYLPTAPNIGFSSFTVKKPEIAPVGGIYLLEIENGYASDILVENYNTLTKFINVFTGEDGAGGPSGAKRALRKFEFKNCQSIEQIDAFYFYGCSNVKTIVLPENLTHLPYNMCNGCVSLESINLPGSLEHTGGNDFWVCSSLQNVAMGDGFNANGLDLSSSTLYTVETIVSCLEALADRTGQTAYTITFGTTNLNKLTAEQKAIATNKNWNLA